MGQFGATRALAITGAVAAITCGTHAAAAAQKTASFDVAATRVGQGGQVTIHSHVWVTPTQGRAELNHPLQGKMIVLVTGGYMYQLNPATKRGAKGPLPEKFKKNPDNFSLMLGTFAFDAADVLKHAKRVRTEKAAGFTCDVLQRAANKGGAKRTIMLWVPQKMSPKFPVKAVITDSVSKPGATLNQTLTVALSNIKLNQPIPASTFAVPAGYKIMDAPSGPPPGAVVPGK